MKLTTLTLLLVGFALSARAELKLPAIIGDNMVLQQKQANPIWGWDAPGTEVTVTFAGQTKTAKAGEDGKWTVKLDPVPANAQPATISIKGSSAKEIKNVLVGEVWICSGQSNMQMSVSMCWDADLEIATAKYPNIRLISVPQVGTQEPQSDFKGAWAECSPQNVGGFSAVGFFFGRALHKTLDIPVGLINNAWGGSAAEAWVRRDLLEKDPRFKLLMANATKNEAFLSSAAAKKQYETNLANWKKQADEAKKASKPFTARAPQPPDSWLRGNARPGNIYNGVLLPTIGYGIKGVILYQGEANAARAYEYRDLFPFLIEQWRKEWKQGDFPFYWVQLVNFLPEAQEPGDSAWAEMREAQTRSMKLPNTGQAVVIGLGEAKDIHPKNKRDVAARLVRWALAKDYGFNIECQSPTFRAVEFSGGKALLTFDHAGGGLQTFDLQDPRGFALCGSDKIWHWAQAKIIDHNRIEVCNDRVSRPVAVRYAWADNPACNVFSDEWLPLTPFRTDDFEMITKPVP